MAIKDNIKSKRLELGYTLEELANMIGTSRQNVFKYENGIISNIPSDKIEALAKALRTSPAILMGWEEKPIATSGLPIIGTVCAGDGLYAYDEYQGRFDIKSHIDADYVLKVDGDSMIGANIFDGDYVFIKKNDFFNDGDVYAVEMLLTGDASLKKIYRNGDNVILTPCNPDYAPVATSLDQIRIIGRCVGVYHSR